MANEITVALSLSLYKPSFMSSAIARSVTALVQTMTGSSYQEGVMAVPTSNTAIPLGGVTTPNWSFFYNSDPTNYIQFSNGSGGAVFLRLRPGQYFVGPLDDACVPYAKANVAICNLEYLICQL